jgi:PEGA domain
MSRRQNYYGGRASQREHGPWSDTATIILDDFALRDAVEQDGFEAPRATRASARGATQPARHVVPAQPTPRPRRTHSVAHTFSTGRQLSVVSPQPMPQRPTMPQQNVAPLRAAPPVRDHGYDEEEDNPFKRRHGSLGAWFRGTAAAAGVFGAVLFGRVLVEASRPPNAQASMRVTVSATAEPEQAAAPSNPSGGSPAPASASAAPEPLAAARSSAAAPQLPFATTDHSRDSREKHARHHRTARESIASKRARRSDASPREPKTERTAEPKIETKTSRVLAAAAEEPEVKALRGAPAMLRINSRPWSQIFIDGKWIGNTPQLGIQLTAGQHSVRLVNNEFGMSKTFTVKLASGELVTRVETLKE